MPACRRVRQLAGRQLDDERDLPEPVLPTRGAPGGQAATGTAPGEPRVTPGGRPARPPGADDRLRLVEPDRHVGPQAQDQLPRDPRLPLRRREEVAVEVDAVRVRAAARGEAVRVELMDEPEVGARPGALEQPRDLDPLALVAVDAADDEDARPVAPDVDRLDRPPSYERPSCCGGAATGQWRSGRQHHPAIVGEARNLGRRGVPSWCAHRRCGVPLRRLAGCGSTVTPGEDVPRRAAFASSTACLHEVAAWASSSVRRRSRRHTDKHVHGCRCRPGGSGASPDGPWVRAHARRRTRHTYGRRAWSTAHGPSGHHGPSGPKLLAAGTSRPRFPDGATRSRLRHRRRARARLARTRGPDRADAGRARAGRRLPDGRWLLTLYVETTANTAFVHALNLIERVALSSRCRRAAAAAPGLDARPRLGPPDAPSGQHRRGDAVIDLAGAVV